LMSHAVKICPHVMSNIMHQHFKECGVVLGDNIKYHKMLHSYKE
jgi:hypothetical protein